MNEQVVATLEPDAPLVLYSLAMARQVLESVGLNRSADLNFLGDVTDLTGVREWIDRQRSPKTRQAYAAEAERLLLWAGTVRRKPISALLLPDFKAYREFLKDPSPAATWCGVIRPRWLERARAERMAMSTHYAAGDRLELQRVLARLPGVDPVPNPLWRPFQGPQTDAAIRRSLQILRSLFDFLVAAGHLRGNPLVLISTRSGNSMGEHDNHARKRQDPRRRAFDAMEWDAILEACETMPRDTKAQEDAYERMRFLLDAYYFVGARLSELVLHSMGSLEQRREGWVWYVTGKGGKDEELPVCEPLMNSLRRYRMYLGLSELPSPGERTPFVLSRKGTKAIGARQVHTLFKDLFRAAADIMQQRNDLPREQRLRKASTHWLRHTFVTHLSEDLDDPYLIQSLARHGSFETTRIYISREMEAKHKAVASLGRRRQNR